MKKIVLCVAAISLLASCSKTHVYTPHDNSVAVGYSKTVSTNDPMEPQRPRPIVTQQRQPEGMMPKATAFRMSGDYSDNVAVTLDGGGNLVYYPAPSDITAASAPVNLGDGWWLNRQGIGPNSVFTSFTFEEYSKLPAAPTRSQIMESIIPGATVTSMRELPFTLSEAQRNLPEIKKFLSNQ